MGKDILGESVSMSGLSADSGTVILEGILFKKDSRPIKNEKKLVTLPIENMTMVREINMVYYREFRHPEILRDIQAIYTSTLES